MRHDFRRLSRALLPCLLALASALGAQRQPATPPGAPAPIDPQKIQDQDDMTWADYTPILGKNGRIPVSSPSGH